MYRISIEQNIYIGSTKDFNQRKKAHKKCCNNINNPQSNLKIYQIIRNIGGWDKCEMIPIEEYECEDKIQALIREEYWRKEYNANMNTIKAHRSEEDKIELDKKRYESNKEKAKEHEVLYTTLPYSMTGSTSWKKMATKYIKN
jgi:hypothetical protein